MDQRKPIREQLAQTIGFCPKGNFADIILEKFIDVTFNEDAIGWLYAARGFYKLKDFHSVIECVAPALRNERTKREAQHLLAFSFLHTGQAEAAAGAFFRSINSGNDTDWQPLVELFIDNPNLKLT